MSENDIEKPTRRDSPNAKACWVIRKALRENPEGMTTRELINSVREFWPDDDDFAGSVGEHRVRAAQVFLRRGNVIERVAHA